MSGNGAQPLRAVIYDRVSGDSQTEDNGGTSPETQRLRCHEKAAALGATVVAVIEDVKSGMEILQRPGMHKILHELVPLGQVDLIIAWHPWRLSRDPDHRGHIKTLCAPYGVKVRTVVDDDDDGTATGKAISFLKTWAGQIDLETRRIAGMEGKQRRMEVGKLLPGGKVMYGYQWVNAGDGKGQRKIAYTPDEDPRPDGTPAPAAVVRRIYRELASGRATLSGLARQFNDEGIPTPGANVKWTKLTWGQRWSHTTVRQIIEKPHYKGGVTHQHQTQHVPVEGPRKTASTAKKKPYDKQPRPESEWIPLPDPEKVIPRLVEPDVWAAANAASAANRQAGGKVNKTPEAWLLKHGFVFCGTCGKPLGGIREPRRNLDPLPIYRTIPGTVDHHDCPYRRVRGDVLDPYAWGEVAKLLTDPATVLFQMWDRIAAAEDDESAVAKELADVERRIARLTKQSENVRRGLRFAGTDKARKAINKDLTEIEDQIAALQAERAEIVGRRAQWLAARDQFGDVEDWMRAMAEELDTLDWAGKRERLRALGVRVVIHERGHTPPYEMTATLPLTAPPPFQVRHRATGTGERAHGRRERHRQTDRMVARYDAWEGGPEGQAWLAAQPGQQVDSVSCSTTG